MNEFTPDPTDYEKDSTERCQACGCEYQAHYNGRCPIGNPDSFLPDSILDAVFHMSPAVAQDALHRMEGRPSDEIVGALLQLIQQRLTAA